MLGVRGYECVQHCFVQVKVILTLSCCTHSESYIANTQPVIMLVCKRPR